MGETDRGVNSRSGADNSAQVGTSPFAGEFKGIGWNCQSLYAYDQLHTQRHIADIFGQHDFICLTETRETAERKAALGHTILSLGLYASSFLDAHKGGIALIVKHSFLSHFDEVVLGRDWTPLVKGRLGRLSARTAWAFGHLCCLLGPFGYQGTNFCY